MTHPSARRPRILPSTNTQTHDRCLLTISLLCAEITLLDRYYLKKIAGHTFSQTSQRLERQSFRLPFVNIVYRKERSLRKRFWWVSILLRSGHIITIVFVINWMFELHRCLTLNGIASLLVIIDDSPQGLKQDVEDVLKLDINENCMTSTWN